MFRARSVGEIPYFVFEELECIPDLVHAFTLRHTDFPRNAQDSVEIAAGKMALLENLGLRMDRLILLQQMHSDQVVILDKEVTPHQKRGHRADGLILAQSGYFPVIKTADCLPIIGILAEQRRVCAFHAGWRGTRDRIVSKGIQKFLETTGAAPQQLIVALGPCIRRCCYEVGPEVREQYASGGHDMQRVFFGRNLDLVEATRAQLEEVGVTRVLESGMCTACRTDLFYSFRREGKTGRLWSLAGFAG